MEQQGAIDMELEFTKFYVSRVTLRVARVGMQRTVNAWNHHPIPGMNYITREVHHIVCNPPFPRCLFFFIIKDATCLVSSFVSHYERRLRQSCK